MTNASPSSPDTAGQQEAVPAPRSVLVEVYVLRLLADGHPAYRRCRGSLMAGEDPDSAAHRMAGLEASDGLAVTPFVHSTSWRYTTEGQVVLSYAVAPDPLQGECAVPLVDENDAYGTSPDRPTPLQVTVDQVAAHTVRHLAFLVRHDGHARAVLTCDPMFAAVLARWEPAPAGQLSV